MLFHGYSFNSWSDMVTYDRTFLRDWMASSQTSLYYALQVLPDTQAKDDALAALDADYHELFNFDESVSEPTNDNICIPCGE
jgi:hypothetical protein